MYNRTENKVKLLCKVEIACLLYFIETALFRFGSTIADNKAWLNGIPFRLWTKLILVKMCASFMCDNYAGKNW